jgi:cardiolipin synthase (CMP-forming)
VTGTVRLPAGIASGERAVAQSGSALVWGARGRRFKSGQPDVDPTSNGSVVRVFDRGGPSVPFAVSDRIVTIPNVLSLVRLAAIPLVAMDLVSGRFWRAFVLLTVLSLTDWFDGYLARRLDQRTRLGELLDPLGDRALFLVVGLGMVAADLLPLWALLLLLVREGVVLVSGLLLVAMGRGVPATSRLGKVATSGLMLSLPLFIVAAALEPGDVQRAVLGLAWGGYLINVALTYLATVGYARAALGARS